MSRLSGFYYSQPEIDLWRKLAAREKVSVTSVIDMAIRYYMKFGEYLHIATLSEKEIPLFTVKEKIMIRYKDDIYDYLTSQKEIYLVDFSSQIEKILKKGIQISQDATCDILRMDRILMQYKDKVDEERKKADMVAKPQTPIMYTSKTGLREQIQVPPAEEVKQSEITKSKPQEAPKTTKKPETNASKALGDSIIDAIIGDFNIDIS